MAQDDDTPQYIRSPKAERAWEDNFRNTDEAFELLALIAAEFQSDPMSVQCFDLRVVERVRLCVAKRKEYVDEGQWL